MSNSKRTTRSSKVSFANTPERDVQALILNWLKAARYFAVRVPVGAVPHTRGDKFFWRKSPLRGFPDILGVMKNRPGQMFCIECKSSTGRVSPEQKVMIESLREAGVLVIVARTLAEVIEKLKEVDRVGYATDSSI
jgi:VRR-NUC domain